MRASRENPGPALLVVAGLAFGGAAAVLIPTGAMLLNPVSAIAADSVAAPAPAKSAPAKPAPAAVAPAAPAKPAPSAVAPAAPAKPAPSAVAPAAPAKPAPAAAAPTPAKPAPAAAAPAISPAAAAGKAQAQPAAPSSAPVRSTPVSKVTPAGPAPQVASAPPVKAGAAKGRTASGGTLARVAAPAPGAKPTLVQQAAQLDEHVTYQYNALGRRDPFQSIVTGFVGADVGGDAPVDVGGIKVVGIMWGASDKFALVEDGRGNSLVLRAGDKVMNGEVEALQREAVVVKLTVDGQTQSVVIPLTRKGDQTNASR